MNINGRNMKQAEVIVKYCTDAGMAPELSMGLWNHLVRVYNRIEVLEKSAAEEHGVAALQSGEAPSQQLKPKMPGFLAVIEHVEGVYGVLSEREGQIVSRTREFISRHFGH